MDHTKNISPEYPLIATKLHIPSLRPKVVSRPRLTRQLDEGLAGKLTLISAPAGFGKTTLLAEWLLPLAREQGSGGAREQGRTNAGEQGNRGAEEKKISPAPHHLCTPAQNTPAPLHVCWLSLDSADNDPIRFWTYVIAALQAVQAGLSQKILPLLRTSQPQPLPLETGLTLLINEITAVPDPIVLVLDDYHLITLESIHQTMAFLVDHLPSQMHLVIAGRAEPPVPLARLRARGQLLELRPDDLRFTPAETAEFLNRVTGLKLDEADIALLETRTEGWAAGLQLAALSIRGQKDISSFITAFKGDNHYILDYFTQEVLAQQTEAIQNFLLRTAILNRLTAPLCDILTGQIGSSAILAQLERNNLFIAPLDQTRRWYHYHPLFADLLRHQLSRQATPEEIAELHRQASDWYIQHDLSEEAIGHALAAQDFERAASLVEMNISPRLMRGEAATILQWLQSFPSAWLYMHPTLCLGYAWSLLATAQFDAVEPYLQATAQALDNVSLTGRGRSDLAVVTDMWGQIAAIRATAALNLGDPVTAIQLGPQALANLSSTNQIARSVISLNLADAYLANNDLAEATRAYEAALQEAPAVENFLISLNALSKLAEIQARQGRLHAAATGYRQTLQFAQAQGRQTLPVTGMAAEGLAWLLYEWNDLENARHYAQDAIERFQAWGHHGHLLKALLCRAWIKRAAGDKSGAWQDVGAAEQLARKIQQPRRLWQVAAFQIRFWLAQGNLTAALQAFEAAGLDLATPSQAMAQPAQPLNGLYYSNHLIRARLLVAHHNFDQAQILLEQVFQQAQAKGLVWTMITTLTIRAMAFQSQGNQPQALAALANTLTLAEPEGYIRTFLNEGRPMAELLSLFCLQPSRSHLKSYAGRLLAAFAPPNKPATGGPGFNIPTINPPLTGDPPPHLSQREREILQLIAANLSNQEIADTLIVSINTVKTHIKRIYEKLNVRNRVGLIEQARELDLL